MKVNAIKLDKISKHYIKKERKITAVDNLSYTFNYGTMYIIMGHSGSGKSTLIQCLGTLEKITTGNIYIDNKNISDLTEKELNFLRNTKIGFIFQDYNLNKNMTAYENVMLPMLINKKLKDQDLKKRAIKLLYEVGLDKRVNHYPKEMSGGEQQRVAIARAVANDPKIILADEPTGNLDEENEKAIFKKLREMANSGKCVIVVSHATTAKEFADVIINMKNGKFGDNNEI